MNEIEGVLPPLGEALSKRGYTELTPVQTAVLAPNLRDADALVSAQTGSGKTVAFGLNLAPTLLGDAERFSHAPAPLALIVAPTRELALQVKRELDWLYAMTGASIASCVGGMDMRTERRTLQRGAHIVVGTPGRLRDHIERGSLDTTAFKAVVLDEADEMLDLGFRDDLEYILDAAPSDRRTLMFSATVPRTIASLAKRYQRDAVRVSTTAEREQHEDIEYRALTVAPNDRENAIINVLRFYEAKNALVFCATRAAVNRMTSRFTNRGFSVVALSGELSQNERTHALQAMRDGRARVCIATDVAARGIDLPNLELVVHADLPRNREALLHRSGRTGRAGRKGVCVLIVPYNERRKTERLLQWGNVTADWGKPPSIEDITKRDNERLLEDPALTEPLREDEREFAKELASRHSPEQIAAAFLRLYAKDRTAPEELIDAGPPDRSERKQKRRDDFENGVWFTLSVGHKHHAEARWLVPMLCRAGHLTKRDIGAIRVQSSETHVELSPGCVDKFLEAVGPTGKVEKTISVARHQGPAPARGEPRGRKPHTPRKPGGRDDFKPKRNFERKPREAAAERPREAKPKPPAPRPRAETPVAPPPPSPKPPAAPKADAPPKQERAPEQKPRAKTKDAGNEKKGWAKAKPKKKKPGKLKLGDKPARGSGKGGPKGRSADQAGFTPLRRKKPKKKSVKVFTPKGKPDKASG